VQAHRPQRGDLFDFLEIALGTLPIAEGAAETGAGQEAVRNIIALAGTAQFLVGFVEPCARNGRIITGNRRCGLQGDGFQGETQMRLAKAKQIEGNI